MRLPQAWNIGAQTLFFGKSGNQTATLSVIAILVHPVTVALWPESRFTLELFLFRWLLFGWPLPIRSASG